MVKNLDSILSPLEGVLLKISEIKTIHSGLRDTIGRSWFFFLIRGWRNARVLFKSTKWGLEHSPEAKFVQRLALVAAMYKMLTVRMDKDEAFDVIRRIVVKIGFDEQSIHARKLGHSWKTEFDRLEAFHDLMDMKGGPRFNTRTFLQRDEDVCHFRITRCVFYDFFKSVDVPGLARLFCEVDRVFFTTEFPSVRFHRNGSWENTIAYGNEFCEFIFEA